MIAKTLNSIFEGLDKFSSLYRRKPDAVGRAVLTSEPKAEVPLKRVRKRTT